VLYLKAREVCPDKPSSMFEIGYLTMGRSSIFAICFCIFINSFFLIVIFVSVWSSTAEDVVSNLRSCKGTTEGCGLLGDQWLYALIIFVVMLPTTYMKEIAELHIVSMSLFGAALLFVAINIVQMFVRKHEHFSNPDKDYSVYWWPVQTSTRGEIYNIVDIINAFTIVFTAVSF